MKQFALASFVLFWLLAGCGKVGDPHPPAIRVPAKIDDLKASQTEARVTLTWTNPSRNGDGTKVDDLTVFHILEGEKEIKAGSALLPGKPQSVSIDVSGQLNTRRIYTVVVTTLRGKDSFPSNEASIQLVDFPGAVSELKGFMDQRRIQLMWKPPERNPALADVYIIRRLDGGFPPQTVSETQFIDESVEAGKTYSYTVTAGRGKTSPVLGPPSPVVVIAKDDKPPGKPSGLQVIESESGAIIRWESNTEADLAGYRVYRRQDAASGFVLWLPEVSKGTTSVLDPQFKPGFSYAVAAVDNDGNVGERSEPSK